MIYETDATFRLGLHMKFTKPSISAVCAPMFRMNKIETSESYFDNTCTFLSLELFFMTDGQVSVSGFYG